MKESILDVLLYLFEHYFTEDADLVRDRDSLQSGLLQAGFSPAETSKAFDWLDALAAQRPRAALRRVDGPTRVYFGPALDKLVVECRGFLIVPAQTALLAPDPRATVVDPPMGLRPDQRQLDEGHGGARGG